MKKIYTLVFLLVTFYSAQSQMQAMTSDGRMIILLPNGTWQFADSSNYQYGNSGTSINALYTEAYEYAHDIIFSTEFFSMERRNKATQWAVEYVKNGISIPVGTKSLDMWYEELYAFAFDNLFKGSFSSDRRLRATEWAVQTLKERAYYEDFRTSFIVRHRAAYNLALNKVFRNEFSNQERRRKALTWANEFVKK